MAYQIDVTKGETNTTVANQWRNRPNDQKFLTLQSLEDFVRSRKIDSQESVFPIENLGIKAKDGEIVIDLDQGQYEEVNPTNWAFGQLCTSIGVPAGFVNQLPAELAVQNMQWGIDQNRGAEVKALMHGMRDLRAFTRESYGRIYDADVVDAVMRVAGPGSQWKVPGMIDWKTMNYEARVDVTKENTTLYASDRDVFLFLVDDLNTIEAGKMKNGQPDYYFRGFFIFNSEVGARTCGMATMMLRGVCCNRMLWGVEGFKEMAIKHSRFAPGRFSDELAPRIAYSIGGDFGVSDFTRKLQVARETVVARDDEDRVSFLRKQGFGKKESMKIIDVHLEEEESAPETVYDMVQGITAFARSIAYQDARVVVEKRARMLLASV